MIEVDDFTLKSVDFPDENIQFQMLYILSKWKCLEP